jgi:hypothetical protein
MSTRDARAATNKSGIPIAWDRLCDLAADRLPDVAQFQVEHLRLEAVVH